MERWSIVLARCSALLALACTFEPAGLVVTAQQDAGARPASLSPPAQADPPMRPEADGAASPAPLTADGSVGRPADTDAGGMMAATPDGAPQPLPPDAAAPAAPDSSPPSQDLPPPVPPVIVRAHNVTAARITAGVVYAHRVIAKTGTAGQVGDALPDAVLAAQTGRDDVKVEELVVDVLYAQDVRADRVTIKETHAASLRIENPDP
jgi:hypothetical protein